MFEETLKAEAKHCLAVLGKSGLLRDAYLAGGSALALQLGHRLSVDFDFFTAKKFIPRIFSNNLSKLGAFEEDQADRDTVLGRFEKIKFSLFKYEYPLIDKTVKYLSVSLAGIKDIAAMKIDAISSRGAKRDFIDLFYICQSGLRLKEILNFYDDKYGGLKHKFIHIEKSLVFFQDAEKDEIPKMLKETKWSEVKRFFQYETVKIF